MFPLDRPRRLRKTAALRDLVREVRLDPADLVYPLFVRSGSGVRDEIEAMPMGMHTVISEGGTNLSGGQRQRLLLTRALVHRPRMLLLDEATSALDNRTQAVVSESLARLAVTRIVVAHRLSTIRNADHVVVLDEGRVVESGPPADLLEREGSFARLAGLQAETGRAETES